MFESIGRGWQLFKTSMAIVWEDKSLLLLPLLSGLILILMTIGMVGGMVGVLFWGPAIGIVGWPQAAIAFVLALILYFGGYSVSTYLNAALIACATLKLEGGNPTIADGMAIARTRLGLAATVSAFLKMVQSSRRGGLLFRSAATIAGVIWSIAIFFVVPVIVYEGLSPWAAIKRSVTLLRKAWGESFSGALGMGIIFALLFLVGLLFFFLGVILWALTDSWMLFAFFGLIALIYWIIIGLYYSAAHGVLLAALYRYARTGKISRGFEKGFYKNPWAPA
jgi:hypothetical protein